jgi:hypothetical protein
MAFYIVLLILTSGSAFCSSFAKDITVSNIFKFVTFLLLFVPGALRYGIGEDYVDYLIIFNSIANGHPPKRIEPGYAFLNYLVSYFGGNIQHIMAVMALFTYGFFFLAMPRKYFYLLIPALVMNIYFWSYQSVRQMFVCAAAYYAYNRFYFNGKYKKYLIVIVIAFLFHYSALLYLVIIPLLMIVKINGYIAGFIYIVGSIIYFKYSDSIMNMVYDLIISKTNYASYITSSWWDSARISRGIVAVFRAVLLGIIIIAVGRKNTDKKSNGVLILFLIFALFNSFMWRVEILGRIARGLLFSYFLIIEHILSIKMKYKKVLLLYIYLAFFILFYRSIYADKGYASVPYKTKNFTFSIYQQ